MLVFTIFVIVCWVVIWAIGGMVGGAISTLSLWRCAEIRTGKMMIFLGWVKIFVIGGLSFYISAAIFSSIMDLIITGPRIWSLNIIPFVPAYFVTGLVIGWLSDKQISDIVLTSSGDSAE